MASTVILEAEDSASGLGGTLALLSSLIQVVTKVDDVVMLVLSGSIAVRVEVAIGFEGQQFCLTRACHLGRLTEVAARENGKAQARDIVVLCRSRLGAANGALIVGATDGELVVVLGKRLKAGGFNLFKAGKLLLIL